jgi:hypothetical protein
MNAYSYARGTPVTASAQAGGPVLAAAMAGSPWEISAALELIRTIPDAGGALIGELFQLSMSHRWAFAAREAIAGVGGDPSLAPAIRDLVTAQSRVAEADEFWRMVELAIRLSSGGCWRTSPTWPARATTRSGRWPATSGGSTAGSSTTSPTRSDEFGKEG